MSIKVTYYGHSCFTLTYEGRVLALDPFNDSVPGYPVPAIKAGALYTSHGHGDHANLFAVDLQPMGDDPFLVKAVDTYHDDEEGAKRGNNRINVIEAGGLRVAHLGDLGHLLDEQDLEDLGRIDLMLIPVGGHYTIGPEEANEIIEFIKPKAVIPMHYRRGAQGFEVLADIEDFLKLRADVQRVGAMSMILDENTAGTFLLEAPVL